MTKQTCDKPAIPNEIHDSEWEFFESRREWFLKIVNRTVSKIDLQPERVTNVLKRHFPAEIKARIIGYRHEFVPSLEEVAGKAIRGPIEGLEVLIEEEVRGYIPRSELSWNEIENDLADEFPIETDVQAIVTDYDERRSEVLLSIKRLSPPMAKVREDTPAPVQSAPSSASAASPKPNADEKLQAADELQPPKQKVKDIASELGVKPFLLIHDLMNMGIYANQNQSIDLTVAEKLHQLHPKPLAAPQTN